LYVAERKPGNNVGVDQNRLDDVSDICCFATCELDFHAERTQVFGERLCAVDNGSKQLPVDPSSIAIYNRGKHERGHSSNAYYIV
jgi:hypothetical protein